MHRYKHAAVKWQKTQPAVPLCAMYKGSGCTADSAEPHNKVETLTSTKQHKNLAAALDICAAGPCTPRTALSLTVARIDPPQTAASTI
jgi:hypothetical protein